MQGMDGSVVVSSLRHRFRMLACAVDRHQKLPGRVRSRGSNHVQARQLRNLAHFHRVIACFNFVERDKYACTILCIHLPCIHKLLSRVRLRTVQGGTSYRYKNTTKQTYSVGRPVLALISTEACLPRGTGFFLTPLAHYLHSSSP